MHAHSHGISACKPCRISHFTGRNMEDPFIGDERDPIKCSKHWLTEEKKKER